MTDLRETLRQNIINCYENGHEMPADHLAAIEEMIEQGALDEKIDRQQAAEILRELRTVEVCK